MYLKGSRMDERLRKLDFELQASGSQASELQTARQPVVFNFTTSYVMIQLHVCPKLHHSNARLAQSDRASDSY